VNAIIPENEGHQPGRVTDHCVACGRLTVELADVRHELAVCRWSLIDALIWGGRILDDPHTDRHDAAEAAAEGLLDRIGQVLSRISSGCGPVSPGLRDSEGRLVVSASTCVVCGVRQPPGGMTANPDRPGVCVVCDLRCSGLSGHVCPVCVPEARRYVHAPAGGEG
jgi:hypothetical protein